VRKATIACLVVSGGMSIVSLCFGPTSRSAITCSYLSLALSFVVLILFWTRRIRP
jgi:hypothetical protein